MRTIDITTILSADLKSRARANDLKLFADNCDDNEILLDFRNVKFATRSFIDEFYNLFLKSPSDRSYSIQITNVPEDINTMIETVSKTQNKVKTIPETAHVKSFATVDEFCQYMSGVAF